jgi:hypothetical protein
VRQSQVLGKSFPGVLGDSDIKPTSATTDGKTEPLDRITCAKLPDRILRVSELELRVAHDTNQVRVSALPVPYRAAEQQKVVRNADQRNVGLQFTPATVDVVMEVDIEQERRKRAALSKAAPAAVREQPREEGHEIVGWEVMASEIEESHQRYTIEGIAHVPEYPDGSLLPDGQVLGEGEGMSPISTAPEPEAPLVEEGIKHGLDDLGGRAFHDPILDVSEGQGSCTSARPLWKLQAAVRTGLVRRVSNRPSDGPDETADVSALISHNIHTGLWWWHNGENHKGEHLQPCSDRLTWLTIDRWARPKNVN